MSQTASVVVVSVSANAVRNNVVMTVNSAVILAANANAVMISVNAVMLAAVMLVVIPVNSAVMLAVIVNAVNHVVHAVNVVNVALMPTVRVVAAPPFVVYANAVLHVERTLIVLLVVRSIQMC
eukprot:GHVR01089621.1.p1 GENE.GHVR01089621.1~~GHVR01089621.1.p1  ORF type:complete len:123 (-),score=21.76 GHVR01089621.1:434-802(-)